MLKNLLGFIILAISALSSFAQANVETFGQNRVQYRRFEWNFFEAKHFKIYHYDRAGRDLARYVAEQAEQDVRAVEKRLGGLFPDKINIILYNTYDDFEQTNIGLNSNLQVQNNPAGTVNLVGDKLIIYYTGNHSDLKSQLRKGMATVVMERMLFGENVREMVKNAVLLNLPNWATLGYIDYVVDGWTSSSDNTWKNMLDSNRKLYFDELAATNPSVAGKAFWKYISEKYGENNVKNLLYLTQLKSSLNHALQLSFNQTLTQTYDSLLTHYQSRYQFETQLFENPTQEETLIKVNVPKDESIIRNIMVSPRGSDVAYVQWKHGEYKVVLEKTSYINGERKNERATLLSGGVFNYLQDPDPNYPLLAWSNTGFKLGIIYKKKNQIRIKVYNSAKGEMATFIVPANRFDRILSFTFMEDDDMIVLSAIRKGQCDLFEYRLKRGRMTQITDDEWDDLNPTYVSGGSRKGIVFLSNRPQPHINIKPLPNELPNGPLNAFFYTAATKSYDLLQLTHLSNSNVEQIVPYGSDHFAFLNDKSGVRNRYVVMFGRDVNNMDSAYSVPMTNYSHNILYHQYNPASGKLAEVIATPEFYNIYFRDIILPAPDGTAEPKQPILLQRIDGVMEPKTELTVLDAVPLNSNTRSTKVESNNIQIKSGNFFQSEFTTSPSMTAAEEGDTLSIVETSKDSEQFAQKLSIKNPADSVTTIRENTTATSLTSLPEGKAKRVLYVDSTFIQLKSEPYRLSFKPASFSVRADNSVVFNKYQSYTATTGRFDNPGIGGMILFNLIDKMEDYRFTGGIRIPVDFSGLTYLAQFENLRRRVDWSLTLLRQESKMNYGFSFENMPPNSPPIVEPGKATTTLFQGGVSFPFDKVKSIKMHIGLREDRMVIKAKDQLGLLLPSTKEYWTMSRAEFVHDDTRNPTMNIYNGLRFKLFAEYMYKLYSDNEFYSLAGSEASKKTQGFYNFGFDLRYYKKIYKNVIAAFRVAGAHAGGNQQIMYIMGGVDNELRPRYNNRLLPSRTNSYAFQALASNLRGYPQNSRNGNSFLLSNSELRVPVFSTFMRRPVRSSILNHLQAVAFLDIGSAWEGFVPDENYADRETTAYWPRRSGAVVTLNVPGNNAGGLAVGYGIGARTMVFGYFLRVDAAWNVERNFSWHFSIGTDF
jgi:hypothetical protein